MDGKHRSFDSFRMPDELWTRIQDLLPVYPISEKGGRPRADLRRVMDGIFYCLRTGCQWKSIPPELSPGSTCHQYFQEWRSLGVFKQIWTSALDEYEDLKGIGWTWQSIDGGMMKAPLGGENTGPNPTDRAKRGRKRSILVDEFGVPLGITIAAANVNDGKLVEQTLASVPVERPEPTEEELQHFCADKGYDSEEIRELIDALDYIDHIKSRRDEKEDQRRNPAYRARRWVVERTHSWFNRFRRLLISWDKKYINTIALHQLAAACMVFRALEVFG